MRIQCEYCDGYLQDTDETCPNCAAVNKYLKRSADGIPKTIEELIAFAESKKLPLAQMRFFLGQDYRGARAFGIYKNSEGIVTVYKNKSNGQRVIRYEGTDEAYAVNEIYQKMKTEIVEQRAAQAANPQKITYGGNYRNSADYQKTRADSVNTMKQKHSGVFTAIMITIIICLIIYGMFIFMASWNTFNYGGSGGNYGGNTWYYDYSDDDDDYDSGWNDDYDSGWNDDWDDDWDDDDWDWDSDWDDSYSDWDSDW